MLTPDEIRARMEAVLERMVRAGWIDRFTFTDPKGLHIAWTLEGARNAILLREWYRSLRLDEHDDFPLCACILANEFGPDSATPVELKRPD